METQALMAHKCFQHSWRCSTQVAFHHRLLLATQWLSTSFGIYFVLRRSSVHGACCRHQDATTLEPQAENLVAKTVLLLIKGRREVKQRYKEPATYLLNDDNHLFRRCHP